ncbi:hypothetical protein BCON_0004g00600 [Botryotinia convoluta]|uniref:OTU domain-containing protein n=1 Tax=Botryotinia convoluta TaxID=54673 RepID=A0A4Z1J7H5_9HELO|nr:hypothetical protein BCON_0004g00600 [Botryotinia convoluta]
MNEEELARVLRRDPNINVARLPYQRPERTQPLKWALYTPHTLKQQNLPRYKTVHTTEPLKWIPQEHIKSAWPLLPQRPPVFPELPAKKHSLEQFEIEEARKRQKKEARRAQKEAEMAKIVPPPAPRPEIMPLSPQAVRAPRPKDPLTEEIRKKWPGPGDWEFKWRHNPLKDANMAVRDSIPDDMYEPPIVRSMPGRVPLNKHSIEISSMEGIIFYPSRIPASGDCFFGSVSMALYGTTLYWHYTKYCHLWFFRYVLTHPAHPRYDFYWHLNSFRDSDGEMNMWHRLSTPHAWQSSELFNVTADIYNLFVVLYEEPDTIDLFGQYNATHMFFHLINRNHYESLIPKDNEIQFPFPDGVMISPRPGRVKTRPFSGHGRNIVPPPIALPVIPRPSLMDMTRVLGINTAEGALDIELVKTGLRRERRLARELNDPTEIKWWVEAEAKEKEEEMKAEEKRIADAGKARPPKKVTLPTNKELAADLARILGKGKKPEHGKITKEDPNNPKSKKVPKRIVYNLNSDDEDNDLDEAATLVPRNQYTPGGTKKTKKFTGLGLDYDDDDDDDSDLYETARQPSKKSPTGKPQKTPGNAAKKSPSKAHKTGKATKRPPEW